MTGLTQRLYWPLTTGLAIYTFLSTAWAALQSQWLLTIFNITLLLALMVGAERRHHALAQARLERERAQASLQVKSAKIIRHYDSLDPLHQVDFERGLAMEGLSIKQLRGWAQGQSFP